MRSLRIAIILLPVIVQLAGAGEIEFVSAPDDPARVVVRAPGAGAGATLSLHRLDGVAVGPAIFGTVERRDGDLVLEPSFALQRGAAYRARLVTAAGRVSERDHRVASLPGTDPPRVTALYPTADELPANLLKFYLQFSRPMREGRVIFDRIHLVDERGRRVESPWRRQELWSDGGRRLTLWIHPGRVKQGLNLRRTMGPVLEPDRRYTLVVDAAVQALDGTPMEAGFRHSFRTGPAVRERIDVGTWRLEVPPAGTRAPLRVIVPRPLDHALVPRHLEVRGPSGAPIRVTVRVEAGERELAVVPEKRWDAAPHVLVAGEYLEDLGGNTPERVFDTDLRVEDSPGIVTEVGFEPRGTASPE